MSSPVGNDRPTAIHDSDVTVRRSGRGPAVEEARRVFGGLDIPATLSGMVAAFGLAVLLAGLGTGLGRLGYQLGVRNADKLSLGGLIAGLVVLLLSFLFGGWVAGRMARYDGGRNGLMTAVWFVVLTAGLSLLGAWAGAKYNVLSSVNLPNWFSRNALTAGGIVTAVVALIVIFSAAWLGGRLGARYHRKADAVVAGTIEGGLLRPAPSRRVGESASVDDGGLR